MSTKNSTSANPSFNYYAEDCTNYTSQLAYIAGKDLTNEWKPDSNTWINSADFAKMTGIKAKYKKHSDFAEQIKAGDVVGIDYGNDGDCDHTGFVTNGLQVEKAELLGYMYWMLNAEGKEN